MYEETRKKKKSSEKKVRGTEYKSEQNYLKNMEDQKYWKRKQNTIKKKKII